MALLPPIAPPKPPPVVPKAPPAEPPSATDPEVINDTPGFGKVASVIVLLGGIAWSFPTVRSIVHTAEGKTWNFFRSSRLFRKSQVAPFAQAAQNNMIRAYAQAFAALGPHPAQWLWKQAHVFEQMTGVIMSSVEWTHDALVTLRHTTVPTLIRAAVNPVIRAVNALDARLTSVESKLADATGYINVELRRLPWGTAVTFPLAIRQLMGAFDHLWNQTFRFIEPKLNALYNTRVPALETYTEYLRTRLLPNILGRISWLERNLTGFLSDPAPLILTTLGSVAGIAGLTALMRRNAPNLFCRNTTNVTQRICAADPLALERLLAMTLGFAILLDPAAVLRAGQAVEETIDGVIREMAGV